MEGRNPSTKTGQDHNCVARDGAERCNRNGGGWPALAKNTHRLDLPASPSADSNGNGYTDLEEFLHEMAWVVEGRISEARAPKPPEMAVQ